MFSRVRFFMRPILFVKCSHRSDECINHLQYNCLKEHESMRDLKKINCRETYFWLNSNKTNFENKESLNFVRNYANIWRRKNVIFATGPYNYGSFALWKLYHAERYMLICGFYLTELIVLNNNFKGTEEISSNQLALCILCIEGVLWPVIWKVVFLPLWKPSYFVDTPKQLLDCPKSSYPSSLGRSFPTYSRAGLGSSRTLWPVGTWMLSFLCVQKHLPASQ